MFVLLLQEIDADDEKALEMFMSKKPEARLTLADMIMEKITEKQTEIQTQFTDAESECIVRFACRFVSITPQILFYLILFSS